MTTTTISAHGPMNVPSVPTPTGDAPLEPATPQDPIGEYHSSTMGKIGVGAGTVGGALVGTAADVDPTDGIVTDTELARIMSKFDVDRSGTLTREEQNAFEAAHPKVVSEWQRS